MSTTGNCTLRYFIKASKRKKTSVALIKKGKEMSIETAKEELGFQSEVSQLLDLVINSLYSNREIFLRELVSNAADAIDKLRFSALSDEGLYEGESELGIEIDFSEQLRTITVRDNGIGMNREEISENLGTIAKSGTREFFGALSGDAQKDSQLIGQFGVGFYAAFIVAEKVVVSSRKAGDDAERGVRWESDGRGQYSVETILRKKRGTEIVLHLKENALEFANSFRLRQICKKYSDHISVPVRMLKEEGKEGLEIVNEATALWRRTKKDVNDDEYKEFYKHISHDFDDPLIWLHSNVEGKIEYSSLFYLPRNAPFDLWDREAKQGVKLYVKRVFILDDSEEILPRYLRFVRGVVDTDDLPLNVSRELLQKNKTLDTIKTASVKKILNSVESLGDEYAGFWKTFGQVLKEGIIEDSVNKEQIARLLRYSSTFDNLEEEKVGFEDYISRMPEGSDTIYFVVADNFSTAKSSPHLEYFRKEGIEVLLMSTPIDEWVVTHLSEYGGKKLRSILESEPSESSDEKTDSEQGENVKSSSQVEEKKLCERVKKCLEDKVSDVRVTDRLTESPSCLVNESGQMSANLQRILKSTGQGCRK